MTERIMGSMNLVVSAEMKETWEAFQELFNQEGFKKFELIGERVDGTLHTLKVEDFDLDWSDEE